MRRRRVTPDQYSYNSAIAACVKARQTQQMAAVLARMREAGYSPDLVTYSNLIQSESVQHLLDQPWYAACKSESVQCPFNT
eukprot:876-Heterococcus_DN1.PRE.2